MYLLLSGMCIFKSVFLLIVFFLDLLFRFEIVFVFLIWDVI